LFYHHAFPGEKLTNDMKVRVLLVDDDMELLELLRDYLSREGFAVHCAHDEHEGASEALSGRHDIAVLDMMMPGISGLQALGDIRAASGSVALTPARQEIG
jgi:DNA-binding response OmpR family regulator